MAPYAIGVGIVFFSLFRLSADGTLMKDFLGISDTYNRDMIGWSSVIASVFYMSVGFSIEKLKKFGLDELSKFKNFLINRM